MITEYLLNKNNGECYDCICPKFYFIPKVIQLSNSQISNALLSPETASFSKHALQAVQLQLPVILSWGTATVLLSHKWIYISIEIFIFRIFSCQPPDFVTSLTSCTENNGIAKIHDQTSTDQSANKQSALWKKM